MSHPRSRLSATVRRTTVVAALALVSLLFPAALTAAEPPTPQAADQVVVRYRAGTTANERRDVARAYGLTKVRGSANGRTEVVVAEGRSPATARRQLAQDPNVIAVSPNSWRDLSDAITAEPDFDELWGLNNTGQSVDGTSGVADIDIDGLEALRITHGSPDVVVAVIDDGVDFSHPDLAERAWVNPGEAGAKATNGIDDDANGYIDDVNGWDFCNNDNSVGPEGDDWHATHVAGTIAASLNGQGIVGVAPETSIMSLRTFAGGSSCDGGDLAIIDAIDYAASFDVPVINASWGGSEPSTALDAAIGDAADTLLVAAAGNGHANMDGPGGTPLYPAASLLPNIISVAAITQSGQLASFSNWGVNSVDISAPGTNILSSVTPHPPECPDPCWAWSDGTSMATPHVAGVAALALSVMKSRPTPIQLRARLLSTGVPLASTAGKTVSGRLVNALRAIDVAGPIALPIDRHGINVGSIVGTTVSTTMTWPAATDALSGVKSYLIKRSLNGGAWSALASGLTTRSYKRTMTIGTPTRFQLYAYDRAANVSTGVIGATVTASLLQDGTSLAHYSGTWSNVNLSSASNGKLHRSTHGGAAVEFRTTARAIAVVGRRGPLNGKAKVYVDGVYRSTVDLRKSTWQSKVVVFNTSWNSAASHSVKLVVVGGTGRVDVDAFAFLR